MHQVKQAFASTPVRAAVLMLTLSLGACASFENTLSGDKIDYRNGARKTNALEVPPDLTPLQRDGRYLPQASSVSANALQQQQGVRTQTASEGNGVAPQKAGDFRIERQGNLRWLATGQTPDQLFPKVRQFWLDRGFTLASESAEAGVMETEWAENRAKLPNDIIRNTIGKLLENLYSTGERDKFRTRLERTTAGTEIYISHRGLEEVFTTKDRDSSTMWTNRPSDPQLEAEFLTRLMVSLGSTEEVARTAVAATATPAAAVVPKARALTDQAGAALRVDDNTERAWRRVGLALDRSGFTVEDRDRAQMLYFVRYADPGSAGKEEPNFFTRLFSSKESLAQLAQLSRYRIAIKADGNATLVSVLNDQGAPDNSTNAQRIVALLVDELKL